jgi:diguanylate cyclase (GGDEF)-like protein
LVALGAESAAATDTAQLLATVVQRLVEILAATYCEVAVVGDGGGMRCLASAGSSAQPPSRADERMLDLVGVRQACLRGQQVVVVGGPDDPHLTSGERALLAANGFVSRVCLPLLAGDEAIGVVDIYSANALDFARNADFLRAVGQQLGQALENARLRSELARSNDELRLLVDAAIEFGSSLDYEQVLRTVARHVIASTGVRVCDIYWLEGEELVLLLSEGTRQGSLSGLRYRIGDYPTLQRAVRCRETVVVPDVLESPLVAEAERRDARQWGYRSSVDVPLMARGEVVGVLELLGDHPGEFHQPDFAVGLMHVAGQAVANARLHAEIREHDRLRGVLLQISQALNSTLEYDELMDTIVAQAAEALAAGECMIYEWDREHDAIIARAYHGRDEAGWGKHGASYSLVELPNDKAILESGVTACEYISDPDLDASSRASMERYGEKSCLTVPLRIGDEVIGELVFVESRHERRWLPEDIAFATLIAGLAAAAIRNASLYAQSDVDRRRLEALLDASKAVASAANLDEALSAVAKRAWASLRVSGIAIYELDRHSDELVLRSQAGDDRADITALVGASVRDDARNKLVIQGGLPAQEDEPSLLRVPLRHGQAVLGMMYLAEPEREGGFSAHDMEIAAGLGDLAATAMHTAHLQAGQQRDVRRTQLLNEAARRMALSLDLQQIVSNGTAVLREAVPFELVVVLRLGPKGEVIGVHASDGRQPEPAVGFELPPDLIVELRGGAPIALSAERLRLLSESVLNCPGATLTAVGLLGGGRLSGVLCLSGPEVREPSAEHVGLLVSFASHLSLALNNAALYEDVRRMHVANLGSLTSTLMAKDYYTVGHAGRVATYAVMLAQELDVPRDRFEALEEAAYLHDIGKIAVSDRVLLKPGRLTDEEWQLMRQHAGLSADILKPIFDDELVAAVRHHHERFDGKGYPDGLRAEEIPLLARILATADAYDAMSSQRSYRPALSYAECVQELGACRGRQFDPSVVDAFLRVLERLRGLKDIATAAAASAARQVDADVHARIRAPGDESGPEYEQVAAALAAAIAAHPPVVSMNTDVRSGHDKVAAVVDVELDRGLWAPIGAELYADDAEIAVYEGRPSRGVAVSVDEWGMWVSGYAPILAAGGEVRAVVCASIPALEELQASGRVSAASQTFSSVLRGAVGRMSRAEVEAITDPLTGLHNHRYFHERLKELQDQPVDRRAPASLLFCDLDRFKDVNDQRGHLAGDRALRRVAQVLQEAVRGADVAARYGGDEFALLLVDTAAEAALAVAERVRAGVAAELARAGYQGLTMSIGVAACPDDANLPQALVELADRAMYEAKRRGRDTVARAARCRPQSAIS